MAGLLGIGVWLSAAVGMALKLALPGRFDRLAIILCLLLGWSGVIAYDSLVSAIPSSSLWLLAIGGVLYSLGTLFHVWQRLRFQNAIWHVFCVARGRLPLFGGPRLLALSISGFSRLYVKKPSADAGAVASDCVSLFVAHFDNTFSCVHLHGVIVFSG